MIQFNKRRRSVPEWVRIAVPAGIFTVVWSIVMLAHTADSRGLSLQPGMPVAVGFAMSALAGLSALIYLYWIAPPSDGW